MTNIKLATYDSIVTNVVFGRKAEPLNHPIIGKIDATQIMMLTRYKTPTQDEVVDFIRESTLGIDLSRKIEPSKEDTRITYFLKSLPVSEIRDIVEKNGDGLQHLRNHYPESSLQEGRIYIEALNGIIPNPILDKAKRLVEKEGNVIYERAIEKAGTKEWNLRVRLLENGGFPDSLELEYLLDRGVRNSDVFRLRGDFGDFLAHA